LDSDNLLATSFAGIFKSRQKHSKESRKTLEFRQEYVEFFNTCRKIIPRDNIKGLIVKNHQLANVKMVVGLNARIEIGRRRPNQRSVATWRTLGMEVLLASCVHDGDKRYG
jgi:hypothetical protein